MQPDEGQFGLHCKEETDLNSRKHGSYFARLLLFCTPCGPWIGVNQHFKLSRKKREEKQERRLLSVRVPGAQRGLAYVGAAVIANTDK